jgi:CRP/FNR family transcriptional regulator, cyclic AMP receptor protein
MALRGKQFFFQPRTFLYKIESGKTRADFRRRQIVYSQGDPADAVFYIHEGNIQLKVFSEQGKEAIIGVLGVGDFFGEGCLAGQLRRMGSAVAASQCTVVRIEKSAMIAVLREEPVFSQRFISHLLNRNIRIEEDLVDQLFSPSEKRLARGLLLLANFGKEGKLEPVIANVSQEGLAEMVGTIPARVKRSLSKFRKLGFIEYHDKQLNVHSSLLNVILHD